MVDNSMMTEELELEGYDAPEEVSGKKLDSRDRREWVNACTVA